MRFLFVLLLSTGHAGWWQNFCARHLVADDPYQYETLTPDELVDTYFRGDHSQVLIDEMVRRLVAPLTHDEREMLTKTLEWEK